MDVPARFIQSVQDLCLPPVVDGTCFYNNGGHTCQCLQKQLFYEDVLGGEEVEIFRMDIQSVYRNLVCHMVQWWMGHALAIEGYTC